MATVKMFILLKMRRVKKLDNKRCIFCKKELIDEKIICSRCYQLKKEKILSGTTKAGTFIGTGLALGLTASKVLVKNKTRA